MGTTTRQVFLRTSTDDLQLAPTATPHRSRTTCLAATHEGGTRDATDACWERTSSTASSPSPATAPDADSLSSLHPTGHTPGRTVIRWSMLAFCLRRILFQTTCSSKNLRHGYGGGGAAAAVPFEPFHDRVATIPEQGHFESLVSKPTQNTCIRDAEKNGRSFGARGGKHEGG